MVQTDSGKDFPRVSVILLNWNGAPDTVECLASLTSCTYPRMEVIVVDNASAQQSVDEINTWVRSPQREKGQRPFIISTETGGNEDPQDGIPFTMIINPENYGFAVGNNVGIDHVLQKGTDYILLLNNDTTVEPGFLNILTDYLELHPGVAVVTPQIRYYSRPQLIWNCGGRLTRNGSRKYYYDDKPVETLKGCSDFEITFITGCAMFVRASVFQKLGVLSKDFFFGEEDYEFSLRLKKNGCKSVCVAGAVIYHKVNASISKASDAVAGKIFIHYLNRFIDLRKYMPGWRWKLWRLSACMMILAKLTLRHKFAIGRSMRIIRLLLKKSSVLNSVDKATFERYIKVNFKGDVPEGL